MGKIKQLLIRNILYYYKNQNYSFEEIYSPEFIVEKNLNDLWDRRENRNDNWKPFVKFVLFDQEEKKYISERIMKLLFDSQDAIGKHFEISTDAGKFTLPDRLSEFLRLRALCLDFSKIYRKIMSRINFDYPKREFSGKYIRGKNDWNKTSRNSFGMFPTNFNTRSWVREFDTPENRLLLLCANWIKQDSIKILKSNFKEPLSIDEKDILIQIHESILNIISHFPFSDVTRQVHGLKNLRKDSPQTVNLRREVNKRILEGKIKNPEYGNLQRWVGQYLDLSPEGIVHDDDMFVVESLTNIDSLYEILIFLEFYTYLKNIKQCNPRLKLHNDQNYKIIFPIGDNEVEFYHEKKFGLNDNSSPSWVLTSEPDYTALVDNKIVAVFDAKNYFRIEKKLQKEFEIYSRTQKCFENLKKLKIGKENQFSHNWGDVIKPVIVNEFVKHLESGQNFAIDYCQKLVDELKKDNEKMYREYKNQKQKANEKRNEATVKILSYVTNLDVNYGALIFPKEDNKLFTYPNKKKQTPRFHNNLMIEHMRLDYNEKYAQATRESTVELIYKAIEFGIKSQSANPPLINY